MKPSYKDDYGQAVDSPLNAFIYEVTEAGENIPPHNVLVSAVLLECNRYRDTEHYLSNQPVVTKAINDWLSVNE